MLLLFFAFVLDLDLDLERDERDERDDTDEALLVGDLVPLRVVGSVGRVCLVKGAAVVALAAVLELAMRRMWPGYVRV